MNIMKQKNVELRSGMAVKVLCRIVPISSEYMCLCNVDYGISLMRVRGERYLVCVCVL